MIGIRHCASGFALALLLAAAGATGAQESQPSTQAMAPPGDPKPINLTQTDGKVRASLAMPSDTAEVGAGVPVVITVVADETVKLLPIEISEKLGVFEVRDLVRTTTREGGSRTMRVAFSLSTYESGELELPPIKVEWSDEGQSKGSLEVGPATLTIVSLVGDEFDPANIKDIKGPVEIYTGFNWWWLAAGGAVAIGVIALLMARQRRRQAQHTLPSDIWALAQLDALEREGLVSRGEVHAYWVRLSTVVREYIERRFEIAAPEQTTKEFLAKAGDHPMIGAQHRHILTDFLKAADMVKFAAHLPPAQECSRGMDAARDFVRDTAPVEEALKDAPAKSEVRA